MSFISRFSKQAWFWVVLILLAIEIIVRLLPMYRAAGGGVLLTNQRAKLLDSDRSEFDYIIFGESRSLALDGHPPTAEEPYSVYNLSVPAMGSHYFTYYFKKYMQSRKHAPAAVIFAGDPAVFEQGWNQPLHDPGRVYTDDRGQGLGDYLWNRFTRRLEQALQLDAADSSNQPQQIQNQHWDTYKHRYLHLFSFRELAEQYVGPERIFILAEKTPLLYATYRWREPINRFTFGLDAAALKDLPVPDHCQRGCVAANDPTCYPDYPRLQANQMLLEHLHATYGQVNLADRKSPADRMKLIALRDQAMQVFKTGIESGEPDLRPLESLAKEAARYNTKLILASATSAANFKDASYYKKFRQALEPLLHKYPNMQVVDFDLQHLNEDYFIDNAHYTCEGAQLVNQDFYKTVMPRVLKLAPYQNVQRQNKLAELDE